MPRLPESGCRKPLTQCAHERVAALLGEGDLAVDATAGNGHDTLFLARGVGGDGHVWAFDIQQQAIDACRTRLSEAGLAERVSLIRDGHQFMPQYLPETARGQIRVVMFNLGYLPGSDKAVTTTAETTLKALDAAAALLSREGLLSVLVYRGHDGGEQEAQAVAEWMRRRPRVDRIGGRGDSDPILYLLRRP